MPLSDAHHFRKMVAGACMILAPVLLLVAAVVHPSLDTDAGPQLAEIAANRDAWYIAELIGLVSIVFGVPAVLGLMHMLRERHVAEGHVGGAFALLGLLAFCGGSAISMVMWLMAEAGTNRAEMTALLDRITESAGIVIPFFVMSFAFAIGMAVLAYGLFAAKAVSPISAGFLGLSGIVLVLGFAVAETWLAIVGAAFLCVGLCPIGYMVWRETDAEWDHTPEFHGFRPAAGTSS